ncbi:MAG TPA: [FeFe] hydrogenase H-cluster radical SAM maturase HydG [Lentisphaeria bacterium]|nr:MAG: [FeFe] hydrogenase H-cluster radical SAM maturase HydG [Lentisphaerae bacterium GWF2_38_69]HBM17359.1 [FeFe] hydrogenase H-cluster radical SAM maturase HydG [Lentisphaeria bacterium]
MEKYSRGHSDFINDADLDALILKTKEDKLRIRDVLSKSMSKVALSAEECAALIAAEDEDTVEEIKEAARKLKKEVYGNRIVIFAPLYIGNHCINDCEYCAFRKSLRTTVRKTLTENELVSEVKALENVGHKRLILVFGEHPDYSPGFIADTVRKVYSVKSGHGEIRRVNINAAPMDVEGFRIVKDSGIGTYQIFQETYHHKTYEKMHPKNTCKGDYLYRQDGLSRAFEAGCDDMGIGALFGLYDWRFEAIALVKHSLYLQERYGVGPHTISFPRIRPAHGVELDSRYFVSDKDFVKLIAILRLSVPYTGMILTARESAKIRNEALGFGVSQIDAGSCIELGGYAKGKEKNEGNKEQFSLSDTRSMEEIVNELIQTGYLPSFCTSCYRLGRTGKVFMEYAIPGFIGDFCTPNALLTLKEYLLDYASEETKGKGLDLINNEMQKISDLSRRKIVNEKLKALDDDQRDMLF